jgi:hypothetical protein
VNSQAQCVSAGKGSAPCQIPFQGTMGPITLDPTGSFSLVLQDNTQVTPASTQWLFSVTSQGSPPPLGTGPQACTATITISGASQSISSNFAACPALSSTGAIASVPAKNAIDITAAPYNVVFDAKWDLNATYSTAATTCNGNTVPAGTCITLSGAAGAPTFTSTAVDGGKTGFGYTSCPNTGEQCAAVGVARTTIVTVFDSTHAQLANAASTSGSGSTFVWGTTGQTSAIRNAFAAMTGTTPTATAIMLPCPTGQQTGGLIWDGGVSIPGHAGNIGVYGCPNGATVLIPTRDLPGGVVGSGHGDIFYDPGTGVGQSNTTQYGTGDVIQNLLFWGAGAPTNTFATAAHAAVQISGPAYLNNVSVEAYLWNISGGYLYDGMNCTTCTLINCTDFAGGNSADVLNSEVNGGVWGAGNSGFPGLTAIGTGSVNGAAASTVHNAYIFGGLSASQIGLSIPATNTTVVKVYGNYVGPISVAGGTVSIEDNQILNNTSNTVTPLAVSGGKVSIKDNVWSISNNQPWAVVTGGLLNNLGGNTGLAGTGGLTVTSPGTYAADGHSVKAVCTGVATASSTLALISTGTSLTGTALTTTCTGTTLDKGIAVQGARTLQNLTCASSSTTVSVVCTAMTSHNGGAFASSGVTCTMTAATSCTDGVHTLAVADGDFVTIQIVTGAAETGANIKAQVEWN